MWSKCADDLDDLNEPGGIVLSEGFIQVLFQVLEEWWQATKRVFHLSEEVSPCHPGTAGNRKEVVVVVMVVEEEEPSGSTMWRTNTSVASTNRGRWNPS